MSDINTEYTWHALYTKSRAEKKVATALTKKGIENYLPLRKELHQWSDRKKWVEVPAISSYIFVKISAEQYNWLFDVHGIVAYVSYKGKAVTIPENQIMAMKQTIEGKVAFDIETNTIIKGKKVTITTGPLTGITGIVKSIKGNKKLYVDITNIGYTLVIDIDDVTVAV